MECKAVWNWLAETQIVRMIAELQTRVSLEKTQNNSLLGVQCILMGRVATLFSCTDLSSLKQIVPLNARLHLLSAFHAKPPSCLKSELNTERAKLL